MEFRILGPLEVSRALDDVVPLGGLQQRAVLAVLLLHRGEKISVDRLVDALWEHDPPPTAAKSVQVYVSQLRKALGDGLLETSGHSYVLNLVPRQVDVERFEDLVEQGRQQMASGDALTAADSLREALALWRGPALADFVYKAFARSEIARLEELRLAALEERIEADLRVGREAELVAELESLIRQHPLRERLRGQLMLALYRTGRQAEALDNYRVARESLVDEFGLEPGTGLRELERAILNHDPSLDVPARLAQGQSLNRPHRRRLVAAAAGVLVLAAIGVPVALNRQDPPPVHIPVVPNSVAIIDPATNQVVRDVPVGNSPTSIATGNGAAWVLNADDHTISRVDASSTAAVKTFAVAGEPTDLAVGEGSVWVGSGVPVKSSETFATLDPNMLTRVDPESTTVIERIALPESLGGALAGRATGQRQIVVSDEAVWTVDGDGTLWRVDSGGGVRAAFARDDHSSRALALGNRGLWVVGDDSVALVNTASGEIDFETDLATFALVSIATGDDAAWVTDPIAGTLWRVDPGVRPLTRAIPVGVGGWSVAYGAGAVWVANALDGTLTRVDPATRRVAARIRLGGTPNEVVVGEGRVWVTIGPGSPAPAIAGAATKAIPGAIQSTSCGPVSYGGPGSPDFLIASDLPLQTGQRNVTFPMTQAIGFVLARHQFRAGPYTVGYQSCDDSTVQAGGWDPAKCAGNANLYADSARVIGIIGPYHSGCAAIQIPILNRATPGPLAIISPANSAPGLTIRLPDFPPDEPGVFYPTGMRNYARVSTRDDVQAAAEAILARDLGLRRIFVVQDGGSDPWISVVASSFDRAAGRLGVPIVGSAIWNPSAQDHRGLVARVSRAHPDGVFLAGIVFDGAGPLVKELRAALGPDVPFIAPDGFSVIPHLREVAGSAARGMYVSLLGAPNTSMSAAGDRFLRDFAATQPGEQVPSFTATYAAQAMEVLLDAIARSDGTRASVSEKLLGTIVEDGILGNFRINANGDQTRQAVTILRVTGADDDSPTLLADHTGTVIDRVIIPPLELIQ